MKSFVSLCSIILISNVLIAQNALNFDGVDDRVDCGNNVSVQLSGNTITLEAWIYPTAWQPQVWQGNIINKENNSPDFGYMLRCGSSGQLNFNLGGGSWTEITSAPGVLSLNTWQHVAATYNGSKMLLYLNGVAIDSLTTSLSFSSTAQNLTIGNWSYTGSNRCFIGSIDEARVWDVARTKAEINSTINGELCATASGLIACYRFNEGVAGASNAGVNSTSDFSQNGNGGTLSGFQLSGTTSNWVGGASLTKGSSLSKLTVSACNEHISPTGRVYDTTGVYRDTLQSFQGCDSIIETDLTVKYVDVSVAANSVNLTANQANAAYRWMDCNDNFKLVPGGTNKSLIPPNPAGSYAVMLDFGGCIDTSACYSLVGIGLTELNKASISVYPNPTQKQLHVSHAMVGNGTLSVIDLQGRMIIESPCELNDHTDLEIAALKSGMYILQLASDGEVVRTTFLVE